MKRVSCNMASSVLLALILSHPALADSKGIESTPQAKIYRIQQKAIQAGDFEAYKKTMTKASAAGIDKQIQETGLDAKKGMEVLKAMQPTDLKLTTLKVEKNKATLEATGKVGGEMTKGTIELEQEGGQWKIAQQSWSNAK